MTQNVVAVGHAPSSEFREFKYLKADEEGKFIGLGFKAAQLKLNTCCDGEIRKRIFLEHYLQHGSTGGSAYAAGVTTPTIYRWRRKDPDFAREFEVVKSLLSERLEDIAYDRAVGITVPVYDKKGEEIGSTTQHSDSLLMFLLRGANPGKYNQASKVTASMRDNNGSEMSITWYDVVRAAEEAI